MNFRANHVFTSPADAPCARRGATFLISLTLIYIYIYIYYMYMYVYIYIYIYIYIYPLPYIQRPETALRMLSRNCSTPCAHRADLHTCHILPPSEIDLGLCLAVFAGSGGKYLFGGAPKPLVNIGFIQMAIMICSTQSREVQHSRRGGCTKIDRYKHIYIYEYVTIYVIIYIYIYIYIYTYIHT